MARTRSVTAGYVIVGLLGLSDALGFLLASGGNGPPVVINAIGTVLGLVTLVGTRDDGRMSPRIGNLKAFVLLPIGHPLAMGLLAQLTAGR